MDVINRGHESALIPPSPANLARRRAVEAHRHAIEVAWDAAIWRRCRSISATPYPTSRASRRTASYRDDRRPPSLRRQGGPPGGDGARPHQTKAPCGIAGGFFHHSIRASSGLRRPARAGAASGCSGSAAGGSGSTASGSTVRASARIAALQQHGATGAPSQRRSFPGRRRSDNPVRTP
jgi:hypothetical protein